MIQLCRHILPSGVLCKQAAVRETLYCRHHQTVKAAVAQCKPAPSPYGIFEPLAFAFPEDRAALQINYFAVLQALNDKRIDNRTANTMNRLLRSCEANLSHGPLAESKRENAVQRVILTTDGEEIAPPREVLEEDEEPPVHGEACPCLKCAEEYRDAAPEQHHANCKCGLCEAEDFASSDTRCAPERDAEEDSSRQTRFAQKTDATPSEAGFAEKTAAVMQSEAVREAEALQPVVRAAVRGKLCDREPGKDVACDEDTEESPYKKVIREYYARQDAIAAGKIPAPVPDPNQPVPEGIRRYNETMAEVERNKQAAQKSWEQFVAREAAAGRTVEDPAENDPYFGLTWNEQEALRRAEWQKQKEEEQARQKQQA